MALCRVFHNADGTVRIMHPNPRLQKKDESDVDFVKRICDADAAKDPTLAGLTYTDIDRSTLPERIKDGVNTRHAWRIANGTISVDATALSAIVAK